MSHHQNPMGHHGGDSGDQPPHPMMMVTEGPPAGASQPPNEEKCHPSMMGTPQVTYKDMKGGTRGLTKNEVVRPEDLPEGSRAHGVHGARLQVHQDGPWYILTP